MIIPSILAELIILIGAVIIDVIFGEPKEYLHPVALVGKLSSRTEKSFMKLGNKVLAGFVFLVVIILVFTVPLYIVLKIVSSVQFLYFIVAMIAFKTTFSITSMGDHVKPIVRALETNDIETARTKLSLIVRRETKDMDATHICSATIETISEGLVDGFLTPMMFFALFGIIGAFFCKNCQHNGFHDRIQEPPVFRIRQMDCNSRYADKLHTCKGIRCNHLLQL